MSWRRWNGWEPTRVTRYDYDEDGRLAAAVTEVDAEWDDESRGMALALAEYEAGLCPSCRRPLIETTDKRHEDRYIAEPAVRCHCCTATEQASKAYAESPAPGALLVPVVLVPPLPEPEEEVSVCGYP